MHSARVLYGYYRFITIKYQFLAELVFSQKNNETQNEETEPVQKAQKKTITNSNTQYLYN